MHGVVIALVVLGALVGAPAAHAGCGCEKPPPEPAFVRPFVGYVDQTITIFDEALVAGRHYVVQFTSATDGSVDWSLGKAVLARDLADGVERAQLRVTVGDVTLGPCALTVWHGDGAVATLDDSLFTVTSRPIALYDFPSKFVRHDYRTAIGRDGTLYVAVNVAQVTAATTFHAVATGIPVRFEPSDVSVYNEQGFLMQVLDPSAWTQLGNALNSIVAARNLVAQNDVPDDVPLPDATTSSVLSYWRHEFATYKNDHRKEFALESGADPSWHVDDSAHVDHDRLVVAIKGTLPSGATLPPGRTPSLTLTFFSIPDDAAAPPPVVDEGESPIEGEDGAEPELPADPPNAVEPAVDAGGGVDTTPAINEPRCEEPRRKKRRAKGKKARQRQAQAPATPSSWR